MTVWMYYATDGDSGYYDIHLFELEADAEKYKNHKHDAYAHIRPVVVVAAGTPVIEE